MTEPLADRLARYADNPCTRVMVSTDLLNEAVEALRGIAAIIDPEGGGTIEPALVQVRLREDDLNDLRQILEGTDD